MRRELALARLLQERGGWTTAADLAGLLGISVRSVKNYVDQLNAAERGMVVSSGQGYRIDRETAEGYLARQDEELPQNSEERTRYIVLSLLRGQGKGTVDQYRLAEELFVSESTLRGDVLKVRELLEGYGLELCQRSSAIWIEGSEKQKRRLIREALCWEAAAAVMDLPAIQRQFPECDVDFIQQVLERACRKYEYFTNDFSIVSLVLHVTVAVHRIRHQYSIDETWSGEIPAADEYGMCAEIAQELAGHFKIEFSQGEVYELYLIFISRASSDKFLFGRGESVETLVGGDYAEVVRRILREVDEHFCVALADESFVARLAIHAKNLVIRSRTEYNIKNPLTDSIRANCRYIYEISIFIAEGLKRYLNARITEDEIAYIAFHIGEALEAQRMAGEKVTCTIICPQYYDMQMKIVDTIRRMFDDLLIEHIFAYGQGLPELTSDLVLTTVDIHLPTGVAALKISPFFTREDGQALQGEIARLKQKKKDSAFRSMLGNLFFQDVFTVGSCYHSREEAIEDMARLLERAGYTDSGYVGEVFEREQMSSTAFGRIAVPHSMSMKAKKMGICVHLQEKAILWGEQEVNVVLLLAISPVARQEFRDIYEGVANILTVPKHIERVMHCRDFEQFLDVLTDCFASEE